MTGITILVLLIAGLIAAAVWALSVMGRSRVHRRDVEQPSADNNWQNEDYADHEKGGRPRSTWVSSASFLGSGLSPEKPIDW